MDHGAAMELRSVGLISWAVPVPKSPNTLEFLNAEMSMLDRFLPPSERLPAQFSMPWMT